MMPPKVDIANAIVKYLKRIYPNCATKKEIFDKIGVAGCAGESWIRTLVAGREIEVYGKKGRYNTYRYCGQ